MSATHAAPIAYTQTCFDVQAWIVVQAPLPQTEVSAGAVGTHPVSPGQSIGSYHGSNLLSHCGLKRRSRVLREPERLPLS